MNIALTGFMGAGKSTTGWHLARLLNLPFVDSDAEIERRHGKIAAIFAEQGEPAFRSYETAVIAELARTGPAVIAVGGGAVIDPTNRQHLRAHGLIVHLAVSPQTAHRRVAHRHHRPLLGPTPDVESIRSILDAREQAYADNDLIVHVDHKSPLVAAKIIARWYADRTSSIAP